MEQSKGLGDTIDFITSKTGIKSLFELASSTIGVDSCGCNKRKEWMNRAFPYYKN